MSGMMSPQIRAWARRNDGVVVGSAQAEKFNTHGGGSPVPLSAGTTYEVSCPLTTTASIKIGEGPDRSSPPDPATSTKIIYHSFAGGSFVFTAREKQLSIEVTFSAITASALSILS